MTARLVAIATSAALILGCAGLHRAAVYGPGAVEGSSWQLVVVAAQDALEGAQVCASVEWRNPPGTPLGRHCRPVLPGSVGSNGAAHASPDVHWIVGFAAQPVASVSVETLDGRSVAAVRIDLAEFDVPGSFAYGLVLPSAAQPTFVVSSDAIGATITRMPW